MTITHEVKTWQTQGLIVVLATGVFDILHIEHIRFLTKAKAAGDRLIVGLETDTRVRQLKGAGRPINSQVVRMEQIAALKPVDQAFLLPDQFSTQSDWETFMAELHPDIYAASSHSSHLENKQNICRSNGIQFKIVHDFNREFSTTQLTGQTEAVKDTD